MLCNSRQTLATALAICATSAVLASCKRRPSPTEAQPSATSSSAKPTSEAPPRCKRARAGAEFVIGERPKPNPDAGDDDSGVDELRLPFAVEIGRAVSQKDKFFLGVLATESGATRARVAAVASDSLQGTLIDLGAVHGNVDPPDLASGGDAVVALVHDTSTKGAKLRLAKLGPKSTVTWGAEVEEGKDESHVANVEIGKERGVVVWDAFDKGKKHSVVLALTFAPADVSNATRPRELSLEGMDAEAPRVVRRPGGFWAAWVEHAADARAPKPPAAPAPSGSTAVDPPVVALGQRALCIVPLDENGAPAGPPKHVSAENSHVLVFDIAPAQDGGLLVAWRDDDTAPGSEQKAAVLAHVRADGSVERHEASDERVGAGAPVLIVDPSPPDAKADRAWLSVESISDASRIAALGDSGEIADTLDTDPLLGNADPLALFRGHMLIARPRGLAIELGVLDCRRGPPAPPPGDTPMPSDSAE